MPELTRPTVTLHYEALGAGEPSVVLLHGWCDTAADWQATGEWLAASHRVLIPEMRGHGDSGRPLDHAYGAEALSNDVAALCEAEGVTAPVLIGHSFGGYLAAEVARRFPGFARAVVVEDQVLALAPLAAQMQQIAPVVRSPEQHLGFREALFGGMISERMPAAERERVMAAELATPVDVGLALWAPLFEFTEAELAERGDALMRALGNQPAISIESAAQDEYHGLLRTLAPGVQTAVIESGHWIHLERPEEFRDVVSGFLRGFSK